MVWRGVVGIGLDVPVVDVSGRVDDATVQSVTVNGVEAHLYGNYFVAVAVPLNAEGNNDIIAEATDAAGHTGSASVTVTRDTLPPELAITSPEDGSTVYHTPIAVSGTVWDATLVDVKVNGLKAVIADGTFTVAEVPLEHNGENFVMAVARDSVGRQTTRSITVNRLLAPSVVVQDVVYSPLSTGLVVKVKVTGTVDHAAGICGRNETHPFYKDGTRPVANQVSGTMTQGNGFEIDGIAVWPGVNVLSVTAWDGPGETRVEVVVDLSASEGGYGDGPEAPYAILSVSAGVAAGEGGGGMLAGGESFMTFGALAASSGGMTLTIETKGEETNVFVATDLRFTVTASACNAELVSATLNLGTGGSLAIFNNGNANPHAKKSDTVTKGDYTENGTTYTFDGFWWDVDAASKGHWEVTATAVLVVNTDPPTTIEAPSNALPGNNDAVKEIIDFKVVNEKDGWILAGGTNGYQVLIVANPPAGSTTHKIQVQAKAVTELGLLASQVSWYKKCKEETKFLGTGETFEWTLVAEESTADITAFGNAPNAKDGKGPEGPIKDDKDTGYPKPKPKPQSEAGESTYTIKVDGGRAKIVFTPDPYVDPFYVGEEILATLVLVDFDATAPMPTVQGWYVQKVQGADGLCALDIIEIEGGHNHSGATEVTLAGISPGTDRVIAALQPPTTSQGATLNTGADAMESAGMMLSPMTADLGSTLATLAYCALVGADAPVEDDVRFEMVPDEIYRIPYHSQGWIGYRRVDHGASGVFVGLVFTKTNQANAIAIFKDSNKAVSHWVEAGDLGVHWFKVRGTDPSASDSDKVKVNLHRWESGPGKTGHPAESLAHGDFWVCPHPKEGWDSPQIPVNEDGYGAQWGIQIKWIWKSEQDDAKADKHGCDPIPKCKATEVITPWKDPNYPPNDELPKFVSLGGKEFKSMPVLIDKNSLPIEKMKVVRGREPLPVPAKPDPDQTRVHFDWGYRQTLKYKCYVCGTEKIFAEFRVRYWLSDNGLKDIPSDDDRPTHEGRKFRTEMARYRLSESGGKEIQRKSEGCERLDRARMWEWIKPVMP